MRNVNMRTVEQIQADIRDTELEIERAMAEMRQLQESITEEEREQDQDPSWKAARLNYINSGDMSGINDWYTRRELRKQGEAAIAENRKAKDSEAQIAEDNVKLAAIKLSKSKGSPLQDEMQHEFDVANRKYAETHNGERWTNPLELTISDEEKQAAITKIKDFIGAGYGKDDKKNLPKAEIESRLSELNELMGKIDVNDDNWLDAANERRRIKGLKSSETKAAEDKAYLEKRQKEFDNINEGETAIEVKNRWDKFSKAYPKFAESYECVTVNGKATVKKKAGL